MAKAFDPVDDGAKVSFKRAMSYGDYLHLDGLLDAQHPLSEAHDELLFIVQHQTSELWMKLIVHELFFARESISENKISQALKSLARVSRILEQMNAAWDILRTMTPSDYTTFRDSLAQSSGLQSYQYRLIEFALGNRNEAMLKPHAHRPDIVAVLDEELGRPSLYTEVLRYAKRQGMSIAEESLTVQRSPRTVDQSIVAMWKEVYLDPDTNWTLYEVAEKLLDLEDYFRRWRFNHVTTVERVIGFRRGTGGTSGVNYLKKMLDVELFPELWHLRSIL